MYRKYETRPRRVLNVEQCLDKRLRMAVRSEFAEMENGLYVPIPGMNKIILNPKQHKGIKIYWLTVIGICCFVLLFQIYDRISYYASVPIASDGFLDESGVYEAPLLDLCTQFTPEILSMLKDKPLDLSDLSGLFNPLKKALNFVNASVESIWKATNVSVIVTKTLTKRSQQQEVDLSPAVEYIYQPKGVCLSTFGVGTMTVGDTITAVVEDMKPDSLTHSLLWAAAGVVGESKYGRAYVLQTSQAYIQVLIRTRKYHFVNTTKNKCISEKEFKRCNDECYVKVLKTTMTCSFPFFPPQVKLPPCKPFLDKDIIEKYEQAEKIMQDVTPSLQCGCNQRCHSTLYDPVTASDEHDIPKQTMIKAKYVDAFSVIIKQRFSYDSIALFCDIGGNLGLLIGLSLLHIPEVLWIFRTIYTQKSQTRVKVRHPFENLVRKVMKKIPELSENTNPIGCCSLSVRNVVSCICWLFSIYFVGSQVHYYFIYPTTYLLEVKENSSLLFPIVTLCGFPTRLIGYRIGHAKAIKEDLCNVGFLDLLNQKKIKNSVVKLWRESNFIKNLNSEKLNELVQAMGLTQHNFTERFVPTHFGTCVQRELGVKTFTRGLGYTYIARVVSEQSLLDCGTPSHQMILTSPFEDLDIISTSYTILTGSLNALSLIVLQFDRSNNPNVMCNKDPHAIKNCKRECLHKLFQETTMPCWLPFMPSSVNVSSKCTTPQESRRAMSAYNSVFVKSNRLQTCDCTQSCVEIRYFITQHTQVTKFAVAGSLVFFGSNAVEVTYEVAKYPFVKLFGDIGGILGVTLGISILAIMDFFNDVLAFMFRLRASYVTY